MSLSFELLKNKKPKSLKLLLLGLTIGQLTACGGGGGGGTVAPATLEPITVYPVPLAGTYEQQTVSNATSAWTAGYKGKDITIAVVDSGVNPDHLDFYDDSGYSRINKIAARAIEYEVATDTLTFTNAYQDIDPSYHGTHVSSISLGREYGVAPEATLLPVNVFFDNGSAYNTAIFAGVLYSAPQAPIINTSISGMVNYSTLGTGTTELSAYTATLQTYDTALVTSAGNNGQPVGSNHFENNFFEQSLAIQAGIDHQVLSVININDSEVRNSNSNYPGSCADVSAFADLSCNATIMTNIQNTFISAPGTTIETANGATTNGSKTISGTSMATPVVSGGLALLMSAWDQLSIQQAVQILKTTADNSFAWYTPAEYGVGVIDINSALGPVGTLKSTAEPSALSPTQSLAVVPTALANLSSASALKSVAFFDDFNRDFHLDLSQHVSITHNAIDWSTLWQDNSINYQLQDPKQNYLLNLGINRFSGQIDSLAIANSKFELSFEKSATTDNNALNPKTLFFADNQVQYDNSWAFHYRTTDQLKLAASYQQNQQELLKDELSNNHKISASLGFNYQLNDELKISFSNQWLNEQNSLFDLLGSGNLSFGQQNLSQIQQLNINYQQSGTTLFGQWQQGQLEQSKQANHSYIGVNDIQYGQLKLGAIKQTANNSKFGMQIYNHNRLLLTDLNLTVPSGMNASGQLNYQNSRIKQTASIAPDSIELFYHSAFNKQIPYQLHILQTPEDFGIGLKLFSQF